MKNALLITALTLVFTSCIPVKIAPDIKSHKITTARKFKRKLPKQTSFIFNDPKDDGEFYNYLNAKFNLEHLDVGSNTPFKIDNKTYYLSYTETEKETKTINLPLVVVDAKRESNGNTPLFENSHTSRKGKWYILLTVFDADLNNCLNNDYKNSAPIIQYLESLRKEYLRTQNYMELQFQKKILISK